MALNANVASTWKELTAHGRADAWKDIVEGFQNVEGVWTVIYSSGALIGFSDYPYPIPVMAGWQYRAGDTGDWVKVTENGEINTNGTFTGVVKASKTLSLNEWYSEEIVEYGDDIRTTGTSLSVARYDLTSFVNGNKGYVCGGQGSSSTFSNAVDVYDESGNRTTGTSLSEAKSRTTSFVNANKGYVCGGYVGNDYNSTGKVDVYDSFGNLTTYYLSLGRFYLTSFVNGGKGYVCGGNHGSDTDIVDIFDSSGNRTTGTVLCWDRSILTSFVNGNKGYVCGGIYDDSDPIEYVDIYDESGNRTTGTSLSVGRYDLTSFVNGGKGYVCGGRESTSVSKNTVDVYDESGNRTTGTSLSAIRGGLTSFVNHNNGYVCGGWRYSSSDIVDVYDILGNRTIGIALSTVRYALTSFVNANKGYVCGGRTSAVVDVYSKDENYTYETNLPITAGSTYTLNGTSGVAETSEILHFDDKVTGTIKYKDGDLYPSLDITVYDEDGTVATGADVVIEDLTCIVTLILRDEDGTVLTGIDMNIEKVE